MTSPVGKMHYKETKVRFNREGFYLDRMANSCWYEVKVLGQVKAFQVTPTTFECAIDVRNAEELRAEDIRFLEGASDSRFGTKNQRKLFRSYQTYQRARDTWRYFRKTKLSSRKTNHQCQAFV